jgi:benzylsuccinate CoA-transferase BbsF subunit
MQQKCVLQGVKILDFSWYVAGPMATRFLANHGATVIKVESEGNLEEVRTSPPFRDGIAGVNRSVGFATINADKFGVVLNLRRPRAMEVINKLVAWADVVVEAFSVGTTNKLGIHYEQLRKIKPDIIMVSHTGQGQTGPFASQPLWGFQGQAISGITELVGWPDRKPVGTPTPYPDYPAAWVTAIAIMAALEYRRRTGKGQHIDVSQLEATLPVLWPALLDYSVNKRIWTRQGNESVRAAPHGAYRCHGEDRWCAIAVFTDSEWRAFCKVICEPEWTKESRFASFPARKRNEDELNKLVEEWTINFTAEEVMSKMQSAGIAAGVVESAKDLVDHDTQLKHRYHFRMVSHPEIGEFIAGAPPFRLSKTSCEIHRGGPCLGEHTEYVCTKILGMSDEEFIGLYNEGVFSNHR